MLWFLLSFFTLLFSSVFAQDSGQKLQHNVFTYPTGGMISTQAPIVVSWIPSTPGPITLTLTRNLNSTSTIAASISNIGSFIWSPEPSTFGENFKLTITDDITHESTDSNTFNLLQTMATKLIIVTSTRIPTVTDTSLLLDTTVKPTEDPRAPSPPLRTTGNVIGATNEKAPNVGLIAGATIGACAGAGVILVGAIIVWRKKRGTGYVSEDETVARKPQRPMMQSGGSLQAQGMERIRNEF
ncbi:hypothetical protein BZA77DRAFT_68857 [Pyronema omphalodes]|nr:hypothetical protein BZA77DRAFT_68857 [Pyronema omphalodes]